MDATGAEIWQAIRLSDLFWKGVMPVHGGALDQTLAFTQAAEFIQGEQEYWKRELRLKSDD